MLSGWLTPKQGPQVRFRAVTEARELIDDYAEQVDTQLIVHGPGIAIQDRKHVNLYKLADHDALPVWDSPIVVETGLAAPPETRSRWVLQESLHIWMGYCSGTLAVAKAKFSLDSGSLRAMSLACGVLVLIGCILGAIVLATVGDSPPAPAPAEAAATETQQGEPDHGFVIPPAETENPGGDIEGAAAEDAGADPGGAGGQGPQQPVAP